MLGAALVVMLDSIDFEDKGPEWAPSLIIAAEPKLTTKAAPSIRTPKASPISMRSSNQYCRHCWRCWHRGCCGGFDNCEGVI